MPERYALKKLFQFLDLALHTALMGAKERIFGMLHRKLKTGFDRSARRLQILFSCL
jgi:hypothetical protein